MTDFKVEKVLFFPIVAILMISCTGNHQRVDEDYTAEINRWHEQRIQNLKQEDSWLSLAGLYRLDQGDNTFGADSVNDIIFPDTAPSQIGTITLNGDEIRIQVNPEIDVKNNGSQVKDLKVTSDNRGEPEKFTHKSLLWYVIERRGNYYLRLKDTDHKNFRDFNGIERYPVSGDWRVEATFNSFDEPETISIPDILGDTYRENQYGLLEFEINGTSYSLAPLNSPDSEQFFIIFGDLTNGDETYGGGRYLYVDSPGEDNVVYLDFNKAYNPPCVFTEYATCPLPPSQNKLPVKITAGEKMYRQ